MMTRFAWRLTASVTALPLSVLDGRDSAAELVAPELAAPDAADAAPCPLLPPPPASPINLLQSAS